MGETVKEFEAIVALKKFVIAQLMNSKDCNKEYRFCVDFLHNYKNENYKKFIIERTGKSASEVFKMASQFIKEINNYIFTRLEELSREKRAALVNEPRALDTFLHVVQKKVEEDSNELFISRTPSD